MESPVSEYFSLACNESASIERLLLVGRSYCTCENQTNKIQTQHPLQRKKKIVNNFSKIKCLVNIHSQSDQVTLAPARYFNWTMLPRPGNLIHTLGNRIDNAVGRAITQLTNGLGIKSHATPSAWKNLCQPKFVHVKYLH